MTTTKKSYGFRLSKQAGQHLNRIVALTGMNKTAAVELAIAQLSQSLKGEEMEKAVLSDRDYITARAERLELGNSWSDTDTLTDAQFDALVTELEQAQADGLLDLETNAGVDRLAEIYNRHVYQEMK